MPGDVAQTGSIKLLGLLNVNQLLSVMDVAYPRISDSSIEGNNLVVTASGKNDDEALGDAGGYIGNGKAVMVKNSDVTNVKEVTAPYHAGGYIGIMRSGSAAEAGDATGDLLNSVLGKILSLKELASVLQAASSKITNCKVAGTADGLTVTADSGFENAEGYAGGFVGEMQSGHVDNSANAVDSGKGTAVENLLKVEGLRYAGGFGGLVKAGAFAEIGAKSSILTKLVDLTGLLSLVNAFVPVISNASVNSVEKGFTVTGTLEKDSTNDADAGSAGGFIGCGTGVQISNSDVNKLQHTGVSEPKNLQQEDGSSYYGTGSEYAVSGYRYAGGYIGKAAMGSTAAIGGASVLDHVLSATNLLSALTVVASIIDSSDVYGAIGGFNVLATDGDGDTGKAGGYAGELLGVQIQNSNSYNFAHIIGRESAGGYVGTMEPGSAADVVNGLSALGGLIKADNLLGVLQAFVPVIKNSETTCVPCGGAVRAQSESDDSIYRGLAGGYNANVVKLITESDDVAKEDVVIYAVGRKGIEILERKGYHIEVDASEIMENPTYPDAAALCKRVLDDFAEGKMGEIYLAYTHFKNTVSQEAQLIRMLPVEVSEPSEEKSSREILMNYEPNEQEALNQIIPKYVTSLFYGALVEAVASENGARMQAMDSATSNAEEMIEDLSLKYNRARQGSITQELTEIIAGANAIE